MTPSYEYIAGFIDADGHVGIVKSRPAKSAPQYYVRLTLYSQNLAVLNAISEVIGGYIQSFVNEKNKVGAGCYRLMVKPSEAVPALEKIMPFMIIKKEQAELALRLHATISRHSYHGRSKAGRLSTPQHITEQREAMYVEMKCLNHQDSLEYSKIWVNSEEAPEGVTLSQAVEGNGPTEGATTSSVSPNNNLSQERPASVAAGRHSLDSTILVQ